MNFLSHTPLTSRFRVRKLFSFCLFVAAIVSFFFFSKKSPPLNLLTADCTVPPPYCCSLSWFHQVFYAHGSLIPLWCYTCRHSGWLLGMWMTLTRLCLFYSYYFFHSPSNLYIFPVTCLSLAPRIGMLKFWNKYILFYGYLRVIFIF